ncbi:P22 phage major capsid protein family protein [Longispora albida]|uniref:P22 phage major capsid protein family protein n=1 Tax=Longispora albida TaxID=203523 RepID=UPI000376D461|nr:P22 phage major capsid protein family protein [Longispora albida]
MAHTFIKPTVIAAAALGLLQREIVLPNLVWRDAASDFAGAMNDTVDIHVPARAKARRMALRDRSAQIVTDDLTETKVSVSLRTHVYHATSVTDEELTLDISDFGAQILAPQIRAIAEDVEDQVATEMVGAAYPTTITVPATDPEDALTDAATALDKANVDLTQRYAVLGADVYNKLLKSKVLKQVDTSGSDGVLRRAQVGNLAGFEIYKTNAIPANVGFCFHRTAYTLALRAPAVPDGATFGQSESYAGLAVRWLRDYDAAFLRDRSVVSIFTGTGIVADGPDGADAGTAPDFVRAVKLTL